MAHHVRSPAPVGSTWVLLGQTLYSEEGKADQEFGSSHRKENSVAHSIRNFRIVRGPAPFNNRSNASTRHPRSPWMVYGSYGLLALYWSIIASVSIYDMHLTVKYAGTLKSLEQNPVGRWLMQLDAIQHDVIPDTTLFLSFKFMGTVTVLMILAILIRQRARLGHPVAIGVTIFQLSLAWYLMYGEIPDNWFLQ